MASTDQFTSEERDPCNSPAELTGSYSWFFLPGFEEVIQLTYLAEKKSRSNMFIFV